MRSNFSYFIMSIASESAHSFASDARAYSASRDTAVFRIGDESPNDLNDRGRMSCRVLAYRSPTCDSHSQSGVLVWPACCIDESRFERESASLGCPLD